MARRELMATLGSLRLTDLVPPRAGGSSADYAVRATGELMVLYLAPDSLVPDDDETVSSPRSTR